MASKYGPHTLRIYGNTERRTWRVGSEPDPDHNGFPMPWMLLMVVTLTGDNLTALEAVVTYGKSLPNPSL